jgi:hypothetical protein
LKESNQGDLSPLVEFIIDCFEQQLAELTSPHLPAATVESSDAIAPAETAAPEVNPIVAVLEEVGVGEAEDPLAAIMKSKVVEQQKHIEAEYEAWKQSILTIPAELKAVVESFNANEVSLGAGYYLKCHVYDLLPIEKYRDIASGKSVTKTWFIGLDIVGPRSKERVLWFFNGASWILKQNTQVSRVSLAISRFDGTRFVRLHTEPISLREIGYRQGTLLFVSREKKVEDGSVRKLMQGFLADIIKSYL